MPTALLAVHLSREALREVLEQVLEEAAKQLFDHYRPEISAAAGRFLEEELEPLWRLLPWEAQATLVTLGVVGTGGLGLVWIGTRLGKRKAARHEEGAAADEDVAAGEGRAGEPEGRRSSLPARPR